MLNAGASSLGAIPGPRVQHWLPRWKGINAENNDMSHESSHQGSERALFPPLSGYYHYSLLICCSSSSENARWQA